MSAIPALGLGTVQFGMPYGISNRTGSLSSMDVANILAFCRDSGVKLLDTAALYGSAEQRLGEAIPDDWHPDIVTKTTVWTGDAEELKSTVRQSLERLHRDNLYGLLVHRPNDLLGMEGARLWDGLLALKASGIVEKIGVSVYDERQIEDLTARYPLDIVQLPLSLLDQRLIRSGAIARLKSRGVEIHGRSIFLQGLMFLRDTELEDEMAFARPAISQFHEKLADAGMTPLQAALSFAFAQTELEVVLVGVTSVDELDAILCVKQAPVQDVDWEQFANDDERLLNPSKWRSH